MLDKKICRLARGTLARKRILTLVSILNKRRCATSASSQIYMLYEKRWDLNDRYFILMYSLSLRLLKRRLLAVT